MGRATDYDPLDRCISRADLDAFYAELEPPDVIPANALPPSPDRCSACFVALVVDDVCTNPEGCPSNLRVLPRGSGRKHWER